MFFQRYRQTSINIEKFIRSKKHWIIWILMLGVTIMQKMTENYTILFVKYIFYKSVIAEVHFILDV